VHNGPRQESMPVYVENRCKGVLYQTGMPVVVQRGFTYRQGGLCYPSDEDVSLPVSYEAEVRGAAPDTAPRRP
jgi:hypothetical protein